MDNDLLYQVALTLVPNIGDVHAKFLINHFGTAEAIFKAPAHRLEKIEGIGHGKAGSIKAFTNFSEAEKELLFLEKYKISAFCIKHSAYPRRLIHCYDSPFLLYYKGTADLNTTHIVSVVGTRLHSDYGKQLCNDLIEQLASHQVLVVSGLAYGIDTVAHKAALKYDLQTVGVMAHGLDRIYPPQNKTLAKHMTGHGGLLTDFRSGTKPDKQNFPKRNRIVAGMCDALVVIESGIKGGSLITAELANGYNKDVFAFPGRTVDHKSEGCNYLVKTNKASLITSAKDVIDMMNWETTEKKTSFRQQELFVELTADEKKIAELLAEKDAMQVDEIFAKSGMNSSAVASALLMLEMNGLVCSMPGKMYKRLN